MCSNHTGVDYFFSPFGGNIANHNVRPILSSNYFCKSRRRGIINGIVPARYFMNEESDVKHDFFNMSSAIERALLYSKRYGTLEGKAYSSEKKSFPIDTLAQ